MAYKISRSRTIGVIPELVIMDLCVPRAVDPLAGLLHGIKLYNIDNLNDAIDHNLEKRRREADAAELILEKKIADIKPIFQ